MISITSNPPGNLNEMDGPALVREFNSLATSETGRELNIKPIQRFADRDTGIKRIQALRSSIRARQQGEREEEARENGPKPKKTRKAKEPSPDTSEPSAPKTPLGQFLDEFKARDGTHRSKLLTHFYEHKNDQCPNGNLIEAIYGSDNKDWRQKMTRVIAGVENSIQKDKLKYKVKKEGKSYGLYDD